jgi:hypothetical protein
MFRTKLLGAFFAIVLGGLVSSAPGCGDEDENFGATGSGKGPDMMTSMENNRPNSGSASVLSQSTPQPGGTPEPSNATACRPNGTCLVDFGCMGVCINNVITQCQSCVDGQFTDCTERACTPPPTVLPQYQ